MIQYVARWPVWYLLLALYLLYLGFDAVRGVRRAGPALAQASAQAATARDRGQIAGYRARLIAPAIGWSLGGLLLLSGWLWVQIVLALALIVPIPAVLRAYATGFAEGRRSAQLAASVEYVQGRVMPTPADYAIGVLYVVVTRILPFATLVYAMRVL